ncbi:phage tail protein, partial [Escherichia coli]|nr:phage tail protein [Escherichia coli]
VKFLNTVGAARVYGRDIHTGAGEWTTSEFVAWLKEKGAFDQPYWMMKASLLAEFNKVITDVGPGKLNLGGCAIEVMGTYNAAIVRVTIGEYGGDGFLNGTVCTCTVYGDTQRFHWRVDYSTKNKPTTASLTVNGWERDEVTGRLRQWGSIEVSEDDGKLMTQHSIRFPVAFPVAALNAQVSAVGDPNAIKMYTLSNPSLVSVTLITVRGCYGKFSWEAIGY